MTATLTSPLNLQPQIEKTLFVVSAIIPNEGNERLYKSANGNLRTLIGYKGEEVVPNNKEVRLNIAVLSDDTYSTLKANLEIRDLNNHIQTTGLISFTNAGDHDERMEAKATQLRALVELKEKLTQGDLSSLSTLFVGLDPATTRILRIDDVLLYGVPSNFLYGENYKSLSTEEYAAKKELLTKGALNHIAKRVPGMNLEKAQTNDRTVNWDGGTHHKFKVLTPIRVTAMPTILTNKFPGDPKFAA